MWLNSLRRLFGAMAAREIGVAALHRLFSSARQAACSRHLTSLSAQQIIRLRGLPIPAYAAQRSGGTDIPIEGMQMAYCSSRSSKIYFAYLSPLCH